MALIHSNGTTVTARKVQAFLLMEYGIEVHCSTISCAVRKMGLTWAPMKAKKRTYNDIHKKTLRDYLITLDKYTKEEAEQGENWDYVWVFMDESYIHQNHNCKYSYQTEQQKQDGNKHRKNSKGRRLIIVHAITPDGQLTTYTDAGLPVDDLQGTRDTPHPIVQQDKLTCECLWIAQSHSGDYHDNMNSERFMQWVQQKLSPTFEARYPQKKMILVADNAPYHHAREIGSLASLKKGELVSMMEEMDIDHIDLPYTQERMDLVNSNDDEDVMDAGGWIRITFDVDEQQQKAGRGARRARIGTTDEL